MKDYDFMKLYNSRLMNHDYAKDFDLVEMGQWVASPDFVAQASIVETRALYTYCIRQDKWQGRINLEQLHCVLDRLEALGIDVQQERQATSSDNA